MMDVIYVDNNATTRVAPEVIEEMLPYFGDLYGNPSSMHTFGGTVGRKVREAREKVAHLIGALPEEIVFTGCGTESDNTAINAAIESNPGKKHIVATRVEHPAVKNLFEHLSKKGYRTTFIPVDHQGRLDIDALEKSLTDDTAIVSIMWANNETGVMFPIEEITQRVRERGIVFHTDAVQAVQYLDCRVDRLGVDALSLSAHKFHGPKGVGIAFIRQGTKIARFIHGGAQEANQRAGTENVSGIVGLEAALLEAANNRQKNFEHVSQLQKSLIDQVLRIDNVQLTGPLPGRHRVPHIASFVVSGVDGEALLLRLDSEGFAVSSGSACTSASLDPSHVLLAIGVGEAASHGSIRVSLSSYNTQEEVDQFVVAFKKVIKEVRALAPRLS